MNQVQTERRALVIDDDEAVRFFIRAAFECYGFAVVEVDRGERGLEILEQAQPDVVLVDYKMPGMDGLECCRRIRARWPGPILMLSGREDPLLPSLAKEAGADRFFVKPTNWCYLADAASKLVSRR